MAVTEDTPSNPRGITTQIMEDIIQVFTNSDKSVGDVVKMTVMLVSIFLVLLSFILNVYIIINIFYKGRIKVSYFKLFLILCVMHAVYTCSSCLVLTVSPSSPLSHYTSLLPVQLQDSLPFLAPVSRASLGALFLVVASLTVERFLSSTVGTPLLRSCTNLFTVMVALAGPSLVVAFYLITRDREPSLDTSGELWFGVEIAVYVIQPLLILTVFGTVNYCKASLTSRLLPLAQVQAIKLNIGVTIVTNLAIFLFLIQECLALWLAQLVTRQDPGTVEEVMDVVTTCHWCVVGLVGVVLSLTPCLYLCLVSDCCAGCCCPAINDLEEVEVRYSQVDTQDRR